MQLVRTELALRIDMLFLRFPHCGSFLHILNVDCCHALIKQTKLLALLELNRKRIEPANAAKRMMTPEVRPKCSCAVYSHMRDTYTQVFRSTRLSIYLLSLSPGTKRNVGCANSS